jgi:hypothetical protein
MPIDGSARGAKTGAREPDSAVAFWVDVPAHVEAPSAPVRTAGIVWLYSQVNVTTGDATIKASTLTASA